MDVDKERILAKRHLQLSCLGSFTCFCKLIFKEKYRKEFRIPKPDGRKSHVIQIAEEFTKVLHGQTQRLLINIPPRHFKTQMSILFVAWSLARYPDSNFLYVSRTLDLARTQTQEIRDIILLPIYKDLFGIEVSPDTRAKANFKTTAGGAIYGAGTGVMITGRGAGLPYVNRFGGAIVIDDIHNPQEVFSEDNREKDALWYNNTLTSRLNDRNTPIIMIGQRLHEDDLAGRILNSSESGDWTKIIRRAIDEHDHVLDPDRFDAKFYRKKEKENEYTFYSQDQQNPNPAGGNLYRTTDFVLMDDYPDNILATFVTCDTAETSKSSNDATVFSFWGLHKVKEFGIEIDMYALHWIDCHEIRVEPKELRDEFMQFYLQCMRFPVQPKIAAIEKKSTGTTLCSVLEDVQGMKVWPIERTSASGNKSFRFERIQEFVGGGRISLPRFGKHVNMCIKHMSLITANDSHRFDDIADTVVDAVQLALIDKVINSTYNHKHVSAGQSVMDSYLSDVLR